METISSNPLKQYFRRPSLYLKLPSGGMGYPEGALNLPENGEIPIYPMTAIDEITSRTPDSLFNGVAIVELIKSCAPNIIDPWAVPTVDMDPILISIRAATNGSLMEIETTCPSCEEETKYDVNLTGILQQYKPGDYAKALEIDELIIKFRPLLYKEINQANIMQFELQRLMNSIESIDDLTERNAKTNQAVSSINDMSIDLITKTIEYIKTPMGIVFESVHIEEFLRNCDKNMFNIIKDTNLKLRDSSDTKPLHISCMHCQHEYDQQFTINITTFFD
jgi:hypothetical protein